LNWISLFFSEIKDRCIDFLLENTDTENCVSVWKYGRDYEIEELSQKSLEVILLSLGEHSLSEADIKDLGESLKEVSFIFLQPVYYSFCFSVFKRFLH